MTMRTLKALVTVFVLSLTGCGTNIPKLLQDDSNLAWEGEEVVLIAKDQNIAVTNAYYDAEAEKYHSCQPLYREADAHDDGPGWSASCAVQSYRRGFA